MILIIESGSTKTEWNIVDNGIIRDIFYTDGINPSVANRFFIEEMIKEQIPTTILLSEFSRVYFYGSGCVSDEQKNTVKEIFRKNFRCDVSVDNDMYAAARGLFKNRAGIACILGTGSNSCFYDGNIIVKNVPSLGYILGDEGSGSALGKRFIADCMRGLAPKEITDEFFEKYPMTYCELIDRVYSQPYANRYLASFTEFIARHAGHEYIYNLIVNNFESFFIRCVTQYDYKNFRVGFVGSVAFHFQHILRETARKFDIQIESIMKSPMEGLVKYHHSEK